MLPANSSAAEAEAFLRVAHHFKLGSLDTESVHPLTRRLSELAASDLKGGIAALKAADELALRRFAEKGLQIAELAGEIRATLEAGRRIFLCGCGATGRLSLSLEVFCREGLLPERFAGAVTGFMAGGDAALIRSIENFEDHPEYGERQLLELGFADGDLLISSTEGGETSFVIGATEAATRVSSRPPWFLYCNPDDQLASLVERSRRVLENRGIRKLNLAVGPMSVAGSTRMQASTVLMAAIGVALMRREAPAAVPSDIEAFATWFRGTSLDFLEAFVAREVETYRKGEFVLYETDVFGITVLTDTTERSPTFSLPPFENQFSPEQPTSLCYLCLPEASTADAAWRLLLRREPRTLEWEEHRHFTGRAYVMGFDYSVQVRKHRQAKTGGAGHRTFRIERVEEDLVLKFDGLTHRISLAGKPLLFQHLLLKLVLNTHSTLVMARLGRCRGNLMTYVKPTNYKLIDRAIRYISHLYREQYGAEVAYEAVARQLFEDRLNLRPDEPIVLKTLANLAPHTR